MAFTLTELEAIRRAIAAGVLRVSFVEGGRNKTVEYPSFADLRARYDLIRAELGEPAGGIQTRQLRVDRSC